MSWLVVLRLALTVANYAARYVTDAELKASGAAELAAQLQGELHEKVQAALAARRGVDDDPERLRDDDGFKVD